MRQLRRAALVETAEERLLDTGETLSHTGVSKDGLATTGAAKAGLELLGLGAVTLWV